jgi:transcriptional regulator with XRE-family HTH domain
MRFKDKLTRLLDRSNLSDREAAKRLGLLSPTTIGRWKSGETEPRLSDLALLARVFGQTIAYLADDSLEDPPGPLLSQDEEQLLITARALNGGPLEAVRRIVNFPQYVPAASHVELTDATLRRQKELTRPKRAARAAGRQSKEPVPAARPKHGGGGSGKSGR